MQAGTSVGGNKEYVLLEYMFPTEMNWGGDSSMICCSLTNLVANICTKNG
jgi:hypothetical protein